jgi:hypothetical protein
VASAFDHLLLLSPSISAFRTFSALLRLLLLAAAAITAQNFHLWSSFRSSLSLFEASLFRTGRFPSHSMECELPSAEDGLLSLSFRVYIFSRFVLKREKQVFLFFFLCRSYVFSYGSSFFLSLIFC